MRERPPANQPNKPDDKPAGPNALGAVVLHHTVTALMLVLILALGVWSYLTFRKTNFFQAPTPHQSTRLQGYALDAQLERIQFALGVYFRLDGKYPADLQDLVDRELLLKSDLYYPLGNGRFTYGRTASGYNLELNSED